VLDNGEGEEDDDHSTLSPQSSANLLPARPSVRSPLSFHSSLSSQLQSIMVSKSSELPMIKGAISFSVNLALIRGIPVARSLRNFGALWQTSPLDLDWQAQTGLWSPESSKLRSALANVASGPGLAGPDGPLEQVAAC
ncbi:unnamed protein product, partial [Symbiodinium sp. CCMP2456]